MLSHRNILLNGFYAGECQNLSHRDRVCMPVPLYHCFGCVLGTLCCMVHGAAMVFPAEGFQPGATLAAIEQERCTALYGVPTMFIAQFEHEDYPRRDLSSLRTGIMAGSPCPIEIDETRDAGNGRPRNHDRLRPNGSFAADYTNPHRRSDRAPRRHGRPAAARVRSEDRGRGDGQGSGRQPAGRILRPRARRDDRLLQHARENGEGDRCRRLAAHGRPRPPRTERLLPHHRPPA